VRRGGAWTARSVVVRRGSQVMVGSVSGRASCGGAVEASLGSVWLGGLRRDVAVKVRRGLAWSGLVWQSWPVMAW